MKRELKKMVLLVFVFALTCAAVTKVSAATTQKGWYYTGLSREKGETTIRRVKIKGNKMTTYGGFRYSINHSYENSIVLKAQKRTFVFAKNVKFYGTNAYKGVKYTKMSKKAGKKLIKKCNGLGLEFKIKKGKIVRVEFWS